MILQEKLLFFRNWCDIGQYLYFFFKTIPENKSFHNRCTRVSCTRVHCTLKEIDFLINKMKKDGYYFLLLLFVFYFCLIFYFKINNFFNDIILKYQFSIHWCKLKICFTSIMLPFYPTPDVSLESF